MATERLQLAISKVQEVAQQDTTRTGQNHVDLLNAVQELRMAAETPSETLMRLRFEVCHTY